MRFQNTNSWVLAALVATGIGFAQDSSAQQIGETDCQKFEKDLKGVFKSIEDDEKNRKEHACAMKLVSILSEPSDAKQQQLQTLFKLYLIDRVSDQLMNYQLEKVFEEIEECDAPLLVENGKGGLAATIHFNMEEEEEEDEDATAATPQYLLEFKKGNEKSNLATILSVTLDGFKHQLSKVQKAQVKLLAENQDKAGDFVRRILKDSCKNSAPSHNPTELSSLSVDKEVLGKAIRKFTKHPVSTYSTAE